MRVASRFSIGVHILSLLEVFPGADNSSAWLAESIGVNPAVVRNVTGRLRRAGLVITHQGVAGARLAKPLAQVTLLDVYHAVESVDEGDLFALHLNPSPYCAVGANIKTTLESVFGDAQRAMEARLAETTIEQIVAQLQAVSSPV